MDNKEVRENWMKIKEALEAANKTDCFFYTRACSILEHGYDPLDRKMGHD